MFLTVQVLIILSAFMIILGHNGLANKFLIGAFAFILLGTLVYLSQIFTKNNEK